jgi:hypothetical protein
MGSKFRVKAGSGGRSAGAAILHFDGRQSNLALDLQ